MSMSLTMGAPQPWPPPSNCQPNICTPTCRQFCTNYFNSIQPPPFQQQFFPQDEDEDGSSSSSHSISPLMAALITVLAAAFLLLFYYTVLSRFCRRRRSTRARRRVLRSLDHRVDPLVHDPARPDTGLDQAYITQIAVFRYKSGDGLVDGTECAVCLGEFKEGESLRLMPNCEHAFHIPCIDTWLATNASCPICRSTTNPVPPVSAASNPASGGGGGVNVSVAALRVERNNDHVVVVSEVERSGEVVVEVVDEERLEEREKESR